MDNIDDTNYDMKESVSSLCDILYGIKMEEDLKMVHKNYYYKLYDKSIFELNLFEDEFNDKVIVFKISNELNIELLIQLFIIIYSNNIDLYTSLVEIAGITGITGIT